MFHMHLLNEQVSACLEVYLLGKTGIVEQIAERHIFNNGRTETTSIYHSDQNKIH